MKMDCITTAVSHGTDTPGRQGRVTALDFLYQVKMNTVFSIYLCLPLLVLWDDSTKIVVFMNEMKPSFFFLQNILAI